MNPVISREKAINTFKALQLVSPPPDHNFCIVAYFLSEEKADNGCQGLWMCLGCYKSSKEAVDRAEEIIKITGHNSIYATSTCSWQELNDEINTNRTKVIPVYLEDELQKQQKIENDKIFKLQERQELIREEIEKEISEENDQESLAYYIRQWFVAIKDMSEINFYQKKVDELTTAYNKRIENIKTSEHKHPEYMKEWLPTIIQQYKRRNEERYIPMTVTGFKVILEKEGWSVEDYNKTEEDSIDEKELEVKKPLYTELYDSDPDGEEPEEL